MTNRRAFLKRAGLAGAGAVGASTLAAPYVKAQAPIKWRLQTYAGAPLGAFVIQPSIEAFNKAANGEMEIELYFADQLVPQGELFPAIEMMEHPEAPSRGAVVPVELVVRASSAPAREHAS